MTDTILCIDIGTTSLKAALLSDRRTVEAYSRQPLVSADKTKIGEEWLFALKNAVQDMARQNPKAAIEAICVSGNGPTVVLENAGQKGESFTLLWNEKCESKSELKTTSLYIPRFLALKENFPKVWESSSKIFSGPEYLIYRLTGKALSILPEERFSPAYWNDAELGNFGFSKEEIGKIPPFVKMGAFAGQISAEAAIFTGLLEGTLVFCGAPDFVVALLGTGTIYPGIVCDRAGSSEGINLCTTKPIFAEGIRTLPSAIPELWNASVLIPDSGKKLSEGKETELLEEFNSAVKKLKECAEQNGEYFPDSIRMTGGQCLNKEWIQKKSQASGISVRVPWCNDAELIGDLILARLGLGDYDDMEEASFVLCGL